MSSFDPRLTIPAGWYAVGFSEDLPEGKLTPVHFAGTAAVLYRGCSGQPQLADATCPHLGARFDRGGKVVGDDLQCPMHHFTFGRDGKCTKTLYGKRVPRRAVVRTWPTVERAGMIFAWHCPHNEAPRWQMPEDLSSPEWGPGRRTRVSMNTTPQDIAENLVDPGHFGPTHGYGGLAVLSPAVFGEDDVVTRYGIEREAGMYGRKDVVKVELNIRLLGMGIFCIDGYANPGGLHTRILLSTSPKRIGRIDFMWRVWTVDLARPEDMLPGIRFLPKRWQHKLFETLTWAGMRFDVAQDRRVLDGKRWIDPPALADGDGPIGRFRAWCSRYYEPAEEIGLALVAK